MFTRKQKFEQIWFFPCHSQKNPNPIHGMSGDMADIVSSGIHAAISGYQMLFNNTEEYIMPEYKARMHSFEDCNCLSDNCMVGLFPDGGVFVTLCVSEKNTLISYDNLRRIDEKECLFFATHPFQVHSMVESKSVLHGIAYVTKQNEIKIGIFDASRIGNVDLTCQDALTRHQAVYTVMSALQSENINVIHHWMGNPQACFTFTMQGNVNAVPFDTKQALCMPISLS